jgi:hypothetical protein
LKDVREKHQLTYKGKHFRIPADFSRETLKARRVWNEAFQALAKEKDFKHRLIHQESYHS